MAWARHRIAVSRGLTRVDELAAEVGGSRKRLWARFRSQLDLPPERVVKLVRFDHAAHRLVAGEGAARVSADAGYADQSHLHRDVMAFTGATPVTVAGEPFLAVDDIAWPSRGTTAVPHVSRKFRPGRPPEAGRAAARTPLSRSSSAGRRDRT